MDVQIRRARPAEAPRLSQIAQAAKAHWGYPARWLEIWAPQLTFAETYFEENESWVAELNGHPVGFYTLLEKQGQAWLENLWLQPGVIGQGLGRLLFEHAVALSQSRGYAILRLDAEPNAVGFYEKMGLYKIGLRLGEIEGQPRALPVMERKL